MKEWQRDEERDEQVDEEAREHVVGRAPVSLGRALANDEELRRERRSVRHRLLVVGNRLGESALLDVRDLSDDLLVLGTLQPDLGPVLVTDAGGDTGTDGVQHVLGGVNVGRALGAVTGEVAAEDVRVRANFTEVDRVTAALEEQETVKGLEQERGRLMYRAEDGLALVGELAQETIAVLEVKEQMRWEDTYRTRFHAL